MVNMRNVEEGNTVGEKRKLDQPNSIDETSKKNPEINDGESGAIKRQKLENPPNNETEVTQSSLIAREMTETPEIITDPKNPEKDDKNQHLNVEVVVERRQRYTAEEKGKAILIEESGNEKCVYYGDSSSSDDSDSDFSDGLNSESEDIPF